MDTGHNCQEFKSLLASYQSYPARPHIYKHEHPHLQHTSSGCNLHIHAVNTTAHTKSHGVHTRQTLRGIDCANLFLDILRQVSCICNYIIEPQHTLTHSLIAHQLTTNTEKKKKKNPPFVGD